MAAALPPDVIAALRRQAPKAMRRGFEREVKKEFEKIKQEMINEFTNNPITQEILAGPDTSNISGTLGGVSNLFAFIGFDQGSNPIAPILTLLESVTFEYGSEIKNPTQGLGVNFKVNLPLPEDIFSITPLPWATGRRLAARRSPLVLEYGPGSRPLSNAATGGQSPSGSQLASASGS